jgi:hypothetical protein
MININTLWDAVKSLPRVADTPDDQIVINVVSRLDVLKEQNDRCVIPVRTNQEHYEKTIVRVLFRKERFVTNGREKTEWALVMWE